MVTQAIKGLLRRGRRWTVPDGRRVYAVGDMHGRLDLFDALTERIRNDRSDWNGNVEVVLLGDYIDRGPQSAQLLDRLASGLPGWARWTLLRGNHEQAMLDALGDEPHATNALRLWLDNGGRRALRSYGLDNGLVLGNDLPAITHAALERVPQAHFDLLGGLRRTRRIGDYLFVHAGIRPGVPIDAQHDQDLLWIREPFLDSRDDHGCCVVHGHSISAEVVERPNRIGIDTGAYATGRLTALVLEGDGRRYVSTAD